MALLNSSATYAQGFVYSDRQLEDTAHVQKGLTGSRAAFAAISQPLLAIVV
ncbi:hypothetical protein ACTXGQ_16635 [Marinobacter sp. 1Y8]